MTAALMGYSGTFMRYAMAVTPKNYLLFGCHIVNFSAQSTQMYRYVDHHYWGGAERKAETAAKEGLGVAEDAANKVKDTAKSMADEAKKQVDKVTR